MTPITQEDWDLIREFNREAANFVNSSGGPRRHVLAILSTGSTGSVTVVAVGCVLTAAQKSAVNAMGQEMRDILRYYGDRIPSVRITVGPNVQPPPPDGTSPATTPGDTVPGTTIPIHPDTTPIEGDYVYTV